MNTILILDLDGVLITTPPWKSDEIHVDGYSDFNQTCVSNLNSLLDYKPFDIWLSSTRRTNKSLAEFNQIFQNRDIKGMIRGFVPEYNSTKNRKEEIIEFITEFKLTDYLILDDDKSLNSLNPKLKSKLVLTELTIGFNSKKLKEAIEKLK
ncbi:HAD domain-containing protein [Tenacibaculum sp. 190524A05c]|uniref:Acid phosphatase of HAD superfamily subfamily IIIB n=1 Tax=Tenacibaculum platacis TaxID=3137852 RepID=A0ABM9NYE7_9FLAO